ncbi:PqiC family protein [Kiritimatiellota bacterium B12222]|nr:PqiC family protein [Kiritimatiellota bacterium B12222]
MKNLLFLTLPLLFASCLSPSTSPEPHYYQLQSKPDLGTSKKEFAIPYLIVGPVAVSPYLDRPQIVLRENEHQIKYLSNERWAEPLTVNISTVVASNLRQHFDTTDISPGAPTLAINKEENRVLILINRLDVDVDGNAYLDVQWGIVFPNPDKESIPHEGIYQTKITQDTMLDRVTALNDLIAEFSADLAKSIAEEM